MRRKSTALTENKFLTEEELRQLLNTCERNKHERDSKLIRLAIFTGARSAELLMVMGMKGSNNRTIPLPGNFFKELVEFTKNLKPDDVIFPITTRMFRKIWDVYRPNPNKGLHSLRHTMGVKLYTKCRDIHVVKTLLGHVSISNTIIYLEFVESIETLRESLKGMWDL